MTAWLSKHPYAAGVLAAAVLIGGVVTAAPRLARPTLKIAIHQAVEGVAVRDLARAFSRQHGVAVEVFELAYDDLFDAELSAVKSFTSPYDLIMLDDPWLPALIGEDDSEGPGSRLEKLMFTKRECTDLDIDDFVPVTLQVSVHPDNPSAWHLTPTPPPKPWCSEPFYAMPFIGNSQLFFTRSRGSTATWADVLKTSVAANGADNEGYVARVGSGNSIVADFMPILWTYVPTDSRDERHTGSAELTAASLLDVDSSQLRNGLHFIGALGTSARANRGVVSSDDFDLTIHVIRQQASMAIEWSAWVMALLRLPQSYNGQLLGLKTNGQGPLPITQVPGERPSLGAWLLAIPANSTQKEIARQFLLEAVSRSGIEAAGRSGNPPPRKSVLEQGRREYPSFGEQLESLGHARPRPRTPQWRAIEKVLGDCLSALYDGAIKEDQAWPRLMRGLDPLLQKEELIKGQKASIAQYRKNQKNQELEITEKIRDLRKQIRGELDTPAPLFSCQAAGDPSPASPSGPQSPPNAVAALR